MGPEQRGECALFVRSDAVVVIGDFEHGLEQEGVDVHERRLQEVQGQHRGFGVFTVGSGEVAVFAVFTALSRPGSAARLCRGGCHTAKFSVRFRFADTLR